MSNVLDLFTKSSLLDIRAQNKINCLLGPTKSPMMVLKNHLFRKIIVKKLYRNYFEQIIMVTKSDLLIEIGFGRHGFFMVSTLNSAGSRQENKLRSRRRRCMVESGPGTG
ncbi:hypothetical protein P5673_030107 [Acropora cervicornis]|uniref:Uncharacterized protein n=1 Tax=Acropora cervicornis TaxID=6130 RepID=A0AAD9PUN9_ACRCE|nr:hypothetical protein P5673_030107 [Acropora cervicornis]